MAEFLERFLQALAVRRRLIGDHAAEAAQLAEALLQETTARRRHRHRETGDQQRHEEEAEQGQKQ